MNKSNKPLAKLALARVFEYAGVLLPDPDIAMTPLQVRDFLAATGRPELTAAEIRGPEARGTQLVYTLQRVTGTKGLQRQGKRRDLAEKARALATIERFERRLVLGTIKLELSASVAGLAANRGEHPLLLPTEVLPWVG